MHPLLVLRSASLARSLPLPEAYRRAAAAVAPMQRLQMCRASSSSDSGGGGGGSSGRIAPPDVQELARLAHIAVTDQEVADWGPKIESIVEWFGQLQEVDVEGVPPALRADVEGGSTLRPDAVRQRPADAPADLLQQAADREGSFVRVPKIATAADN